VDEFALSGVYVAVSLSVPAGSDPAGIEMAVLPPSRTAGADVKLPLLSVTVPLGVP
jgi:hypothetical protein